MEVLERIANLHVGIVEIILVLDILRKGDFFCLGLVKWYESKPNKFFDGRIKLDLMWTHLKLRIGVLDNLGRGSPRCRPLVEVHAEFKFIKVWLYIPNDIMYWILSPMEGTPSNQNVTFGKQVEGMNFTSAKGTRGIIYKTLHFNALSRSSGFLILFSRDQKLPLSMRELYYPLLIGRFYTKLAFCMRCYCRNIPIIDYIYLPMTNERQTWTLEED